MIPLMSTEGLLTMLRPRAVAAVLLAALLSPPVSYTHL